jgi:CCR4-NOT transcription complex subunit 10
MENGSSELAKNAHAFFKTSEYAKSVECLQKLLKISTTPTQIFKIKQNLLVAQYLAGLADKKETKPQEEDELIPDEQLLLQLEDLKHEYSQLTVDESEAITHATYNHLLIYNQAVLYFAFSRLEHVLQLLTPLFDRYRDLLEKQTVLDKLQELLSLKICFLMLETFFSQDKVHRAEIVMQYLNTYYQSLLNFQPTVSKTGPSPQSDYLSVVECKFYMHIYRARLNLLKRDAVLETKQEINTALQTLTEDKIPPSVMSSLTVLRANIEYMNATLTALALEQQMRPVDKQELFSTCLQILNECKDNLSLAVYYNNVGCVQLRSQKVFLAGAMFNKGIDASANKFVNQQEHARLMYNAGIQAMNMQAYPEAFEKFGSAAFVMYNDPLLWVRVAECCIAEHQIRVIKAIRTKIPKVFVPSDKHPDDDSATIILLPTFDAHMGLPLTATQDTKESLSSIPNKHNIELLQSRGTRQDLGNMSIETADICLRNAMTLIYSGTYHPLLEHVFTKLAYVALEMDDPVMALSYCRRLLSAQVSQYTRYETICYLTI